MKKILICGDSFCVTDPKFPMLHWSEKLLEKSENINVFNLANQGCSNALITEQLLRGLLLAPDFVILSFTAPLRFETDNNIDAKPYSLTADDFKTYQASRYIMQASGTRAIVDKLKLSSRNFEELKNYFHILTCLMTLQAQNINFLFSLGGFEKNYTTLLRSNYVKNFIPLFDQKEMSINLWDHSDNTISKNVPIFHVSNGIIHDQFANECLSRIDAE